MVHRKIFLNNMENVVMSKEKDLCKTCEHYWPDFPLPYAISHCEIIGRKARVIYKYV